MSTRRINSLLQTCLLLAFVAASGPALAATLSCQYPQTARESGGSGIGGTGRTNDKTGIGGTGSTAKNSGIGGTGMVAENTGIGGTGSPVDAGRIAGIVIENKGTAEARFNGKSRLLAKNSPICIGETIITADSGTIKIKMSDDGLVELHAKSKLRLDKFTLGKSSGNASLFALLDGTSRFVTGRIGKAEPQNVLVRTPTASVGVHGTDHVVTVIPRDSHGEYPAGTYDMVNSGVTFLRTETGEVDIHPNEVGFAASVDEPPALLHDIPVFFHHDHPEPHHDGRIETTPPERMGDVHPKDLHPEGIGEAHEYDHPMDHLPSIIEHHDIGDLPEIPDIQEHPEPPEPPQVPHEIED